MKDLTKHSINTLMFYLIVICICFGICISCEDSETVAEEAEEYIYPSSEDTGDDSVTDLCDPNPCLQPNKTVCLAQENSAYCLCDPGYSQDSDGNCVVEGSFAVTPCEPNPCSEPNKTTCIVLSGSAHCLCDQGYSVDSEGYCTMDQDIDAACEPNPCTEPNKTICTEQNGSENCSCDPGYILDDTDTCVIDASPVAGFVFSPSPAIEGESVIFDGSNSTSSNTIVSYEWDFDGDDSMDTIGMVTAFVYDVPGSYDIKLIVTDNTGLQGESLQQIVVEQIGKDTTPPAWDNSPGGTMDMVVRTGEITLFWDTATDAESPDVEYMLYWSNDSANLWNTTPMVFTTNDPYTITGLTSDAYYYVGIRCRDTAQPPNVNIDSGWMEVQVN